MVTFFLCTYVKWDERAKIKTSKIRIYPLVVIQSDEHCCMCPYVQKGQKVTLTNDALKNLKKIAQLLLCTFHSHSSTYLRPPKKLNHKNLLNDEKSRKELDLSTIFCVILLCSAAIR